MIYIIYILLLFFSIVILNNISFKLSYKKIPSSYFEIGDYNIDDKNISDNIIIRNRINTCPDSIVTGKKKYNSILFFVLRLVIYIVIGVAIIEIYSTRVGYLHEFKVFMVYLCILIIIEHIILAFCIRYFDVRNTTYYIGTVCRALLTRTTFIRKNIVAYAVLPLGYTNMYIMKSKVKKKDDVIRIHINRKREIASIFVNAKLKKRISFFDLSISKNTESLQKFIDDLTFVDGKIDLKSLFNDLYFGDNDLLDLEDYIMSGTAGEISIRLR